MSMPIPVPTIADQRRIAAILDHADTLRAKRRQILAHLGDLDQAIFREMFQSGDHVARPLAELIDDGDRINYGVVQPGVDTPGGVPLIRVSDMNAGIVDRSS